MNTLLSRKPKRKRKPSKSIELPKNTKRLKQIEAIMKCDSVALKASIPKKIAIDFTSPTLKSLLNHRKNDCVTFDPENEHYTYNDGGFQKSCKGLTKRLKFFFYGSKPTASSKTSYRTDNKGLVGAFHVPTFAPLPGKKKWTRKENIRNKTKRKGKTLGTIVHGQIADYANLSRKDFITKYPHINAFTMKIIVALKEWELRPMTGEHIIIDTYLGYATGIDLVCSTKDGFPVLIEIKTGYNNNWNKGFYPMSHPFDALLNCPKNQAIVQIFMAYLTCYYNYGITEVKGMVLHVSNHGISAYQIPEGLLKSRDSIYKILCEKMSVKKKSPGTKMAPKKYIKL